MLLQGDKTMAYPLLGTKDFLYLLIVLTVQ
jgi:hypothetical protein